MVGAEYDLICILNRIHNGLVGKVAAECYTVSNEYGYDYCKRYSSTFYSDKAFSFILGLIKNESRKNSYTQANKQRKEELG